MPSSVIHAEVRSWTNQDGRTLEAEFVSSDGQYVELRMHDGLRSKVQLAKLSKADQDYVTGLGAVKPPASNPEPIADQNPFRPWGKGITARIFRQMMDSVILENQNQEAGSNKEPYVVVLMKDLSPEDQARVREHTERSRSINVVSEKCKLIEVGDLYFLNDKKSPPDGEIFRLRFKSITESVECPGFLYQLWGNANHGNNGIVQFKAAAFDPQAVPWLKQNAKPELKDKNHTGGAAHFLYVRYFTSKWSSPVHHQMLKGQRYLEILGTAFVKEPSGRTVAKW